ncbi:MAG: hypothetical protein KA746_07325 [Pyrinomonadaceae bacterium]|nr:hypothetical protein [Pyrinomonadaceae bacterium]MBP6212497.1 hypothetical protein [Pyrinomonadaceae bacterium]
MEAYVKAGLEAYKRRRRAEQEFLEHTERIKYLIGLDDPERYETAILFLTPLISIAWTDGRVARHEQDYILHAAEIYGLLENEAAYAALMQHLHSKPHPQQAETWWDEITDVCRMMDSGECAALVAHLYQQIKFIGEFSEKYTFGLWRAHRLGENEQETLDHSEKRIAEILTDQARLSADGINDSELLRLIPLVHVAWADGRVTKRERKMIFASLVDMQIPESEQNLRTLARWLDIRPEDEFFQAALVGLREHLASHPEEHSRSAKYDILSRCATVAEMSGGNGSFVAGGQRICEEEIDTVKHIAKILNDVIVHAGPTKELSTANGGNKV